jgi:hypothetical protein
MAAADCGAGPASMEAAMIRSKLGFSALAAVLALAAPAGAQTVGLAPGERIVPIDPASTGPGLMPVPPTPGYRAGILACQMGAAMDDLVGGTRSVPCNFDPAVPGAPTQLSVTVGKAGPGRVGGIGVLSWSVMVQQGADSSFLGGNYVSDGTRLIGGTDNAIRLIPVGLPGLSVPNLAPYVLEMRVGS